MKNSIIANIVKANKALRRIKENPLVIRFPNLRDFNQLQLQCYSDASLANLSSGKVQKAIFFLTGQNSNVCLFVVLLAVFYELEHVPWLIPQTLFISYQLYYGRYYF